MIIKEEDENTQYNRKLEGEKLLIRAAISKPLAYIWPALESIIALIALMPFKNNWQPVTPSLAPPPLYLLKNSPQVAPQRELLTQKWPSVIELERRWQKQTRENHGHWAASAQ